VIDVPDSPPARRPPVRCAWCGRYRLNGRWIEEAELDDVRASHGVCPDCFRDLVAQSATSTEPRGS
jgi:hypothetical protein